MNMLPEKYIGRVIVGAVLENDELSLEFSGGDTLVIGDDAQDCCETRYMTTDDNVSSLVGCRIVHIASKDGPVEEDDYGDVHETCFVEIQTNKGLVTLITHNEHNGYYGGFDLSIREDFK